MILPVHLQATMIFYAEKRRDISPPNTAKFLAVLSISHLVSPRNRKGIVLLRREISQKVICEKVKFSGCDFWNTFRDYE